MPKIFDFDLTLSIKHTFADYCIDKVSTDNLDQQYAIGKRHAASNLKACVKDYFIHDHNDFSCIATYHNNPDYIAGYVAVILGQELTLVYKEERYTTPTTAINYYQVAGSDIPILISYIPQKGADFSRTRDQLIHKNKQIESLRDALLKLELLQADTMIDFYEDHDKNFHAATRLNNINSHLVAVDESNTFKVIKSQLAVTPAAAEVTDSDAFVAQFGLEQYQAQSTPDTPVTSPTQLRRTNNSDGQSSPKLPACGSVTPPFLSPLAGWGNPIKPAAAAEVKSESPRGFFGKSSVLYAAYDGSDNEADNAAHP